MKRTIIAATIMIAALATQSRAETQSDDPCVIWGDLAENAMTARQAGVPMSTSMSVSTNDLVREVIMGAYDVPRFGSEGFQRREIQDYRNEWERQCYRAE